MKKRIAAFCVLCCLLGTLFTLTGCTSATVTTMIPGVYYFYDVAGEIGGADRAYFTLSEKDGYKSWTYHDPLSASGDKAGTYLYDESTETVTLYLTDSEDVYRTAKATNNVLVFDFGGTSPENYAQDSAGSFWDFFNNLFGYVMKFCYSISFGNYALALLFYAIFFKLLLLIFSINQQKTQIKMAKLRPKIAEIEAKYAGRTDQKTMQKKQQEIMDLQQAEGASAMSGCLPLLLQFPIIIALFAIIRSPLTYISQLSQPAINLIATHLGVSVSGNAYYHMNIISALAGNTNATVTSLVGDTVIPNLTFLGIDFGLTPSFTDISVTVIVPFLVFASQIITMKVSRKYMAQPTAETEATQTSNWIMDLALPAMTLFFAFQYPAALGVYWVYQSLLSMLQSYILSKAMPLPKYTDEELKEMRKAAKRRAEENRAAAKQASPAAGSLHHIDDDEDIPDIEYHSIYDEDAAPAENKQAAVTNGQAVVDKAPIKGDPGKKKKKH